MGKCVVRMTNQLLVEMLGWREDIEVLAVRRNFDDGSFDLIVSSPALPEVPEGEVYPLIGVEEILRHPHGEAYPVGAMSGHGPEGWWYSTPLAGQRSWG